jgi:two-component system, OmpR family, phosphate regulon sensor histidine kinase PhoR
MQDHRECRNIAGNYRVRGSIDQSYVRQALLNLLDNAIKYNVESGAISVSLKKSGALALFRIANTGPEIPKDREARIFERFYRADSSRTFDVAGLGLGLSIAGRSLWRTEGTSGWNARNRAGQPLSWLCHARQAATL